MIFALKSKTGCKLAYDADSPIELLVYKGIKNSNGDYKYVNCGDSLCELLYKIDFKQI